MPSFTFKCQACGAEFVRNLKSSESKTSEACAKCGGGPFLRIYKDPGIANGWSLSSVGPKFSRNMKEKNVKARQKLKERKFYRADKEE